MTRRRIGLWVSGVLLMLVVGSVAVLAAGRAMDLPPPDGPSLAGIVNAVEKKNLGAIQSVEYEREWWRKVGLWEITACREGCVKLYIDPRSGEEQRRKGGEADDEVPPADVQGPSAIARHFEDRKLGFITEIEFKHGAWQVKFREERGLRGALQPTRSRVFEPARVSFSSERLAPRAKPPVRVPNRNRLIPVGA